LKFAEPTIEQAAIEWFKETLKVFTVNPRHVGHESLACRGACQPMKPLGSEKLASLRDSLLPKLMRGEVRVRDVEEARWQKKHMLMINR
jgi:hypothetical protein